MSKQPSVSIVVPCHNQGHFLDDAIASVERCDHDLYELIIVNDGSTDPYTQDLMKKLEQAGYQVINQPNMGLATARNNGIRAARGRYILPLDADNKVRPNYLACGIEVLEKYPEVGVVYGDPWFFGDRQGRRRVPAFDVRLLPLINTIDACALFRKEVWEDCGGYDPHMPVSGHEDWDLWLSASARGWKFYHLDEVTFDYRVRSNSMLATTNLEGNCRKNEEYLWRKHAMLVKQQYEKFYHWEPQVEVFRRRPIWTTLRLLSRSYFPTFHKQLQKLFRS
jgi:glycosyltransferase involved in cell wall biosynthesis